MINNSNQSRIHGVSPFSTITLDIASRLGGIELLQNELGSITSSCGLLGCGIAASELFVVMEVEVTTSNNLSWIATCVNSN